eukprot:scaffold108987_cov19-Tisochrysis_lutea.AAC.1
MEDCRLSPHQQTYTATTSLLLLQLWNAAKYFSGLPVLLLSAFEHDAHTANRPFPLRGTWLLACAFNSLFSYYWDVEHDWKMPWISRVWTEARQRKRAAQGPGQ